MKTHLILAAIFGFSTLASTPQAVAGDPYYTGDPGPSYQYSDRGSYGGSLKDAPYAPSYKDQPYYGGKSLNYGLPKSKVRYYGDRYDYCLPRRQIRQRLRHRGWFDFHRQSIRRHTIKINAQRADGCIFRLRVDRCTGAILEKKLVSRPQSRNYGRYNGYYNDNRGRYYSRRYDIY